MSENAITPKMKVAELIEVYPHLEATLVDYLPAFKKLRNPVLRRTVARVTTLQQAAAVGNANVQDLINHLRSEVGQDLYSGDAGAGYNTEKPGWYAPDRVATEFDAAEMLAAGEHPVGQVMADLQELGAGDIYALKVPFVPAPLLDKATSIGMAHWIEKVADEAYTIYFRPE
jgi:hypothetical protein